MIKNALIKVAVKIRPCPPNKNIIRTDPSTGNIVIQLPSEETQNVQVDAVHDANTTEQNIYENIQIRELVNKFTDGYNAAILTYGQTGSGKTFAFEGDKQHNGIIFQTITDIYALRSPSSSVKCSFIQLYNEKITDMFNPQSGGQRGLRMRWQAQRQFLIQDLTQKQCHSAQQMIKQWGVGNKNRIIASNKIHQYSSRSHSIFVVRIEDQDHQGNFRMREIYFVDLAGSERVFSPVGRLSKEAIEINKSLFFLRKVILSLEEMNTSEKQQYIPYRDAKLTSILKRAFGGNCLTYLIACINPSEDYLEQTLSTLQYAISTRKIHNQPVINVDLKSRQINRLRDQNQKLKRQLDVAMMQIQSLRSLEREEEIKRAANNEYANRIIECIGTVRELLKSNKALRNQLEQQKKQKKKLAAELERAENNHRMVKKDIYLTPIREENNKKGKIITKTEKPSPSPQTDRLNYSHSVDLTRKKERGNSIVRRKRFTFHDSPKTPQKTS